MTVCSHLCVVLLFLVVIVVEPFVATSLSGRVKRDLADVVSRQFGLALIAEHIGAKTTTTTTNDQNEQPQQLFDKYRVAVEKLLLASKEIQTRGKQMVDELLKELSPHQTGDERSAQTLLRQTILNINQLLAHKTDEKPTSADQYVIYATQLFGSRGLADDLLLVINGVKLNLSSIQLEKTCPNCYK